MFQIFPQESPCLPTVPPCVPLSWSDTQRAGCPQRGPLSSEEVPLSPGSSCGVRG